LAVAAADAAYAAAYSAADALAVAVAAADAYAAYAASPRNAAAFAAAADAWAEIRADIAALQTGSAAELLDLPLWQRGAHGWPSNRWTELQARLGDYADWEVWIRWYQERLDGGSRGKAYEWVFATVPPETWDQGPAAANAWIKAHLPKDVTPPPNLPPPLADLDSPFAYSWTAALKVAAVPGAQNLPFYPHFDSEEHHRRALEACRKGAERLLKALREGSRYRYNVRPEYAERLRYYLKDLPKVAGEGNLLLANDQVVNLREMFAQDLETLPTGFASPLRRVIENQFALNAFYDLVKKHQDAIAASKLTLPFPAEAARRFFGVVEDETPRFFEPPVGEGLRDVERAAPPVVIAPDEVRATTAIQPPPCRRERPIRNNRTSARSRPPPMRCGRRSSKARICPWRFKPGPKPRKSSATPSARSWISCGESGLDAPLAGAMNACRLSPQGLSISFLCQRRRSARAAPHTCRQGRDRCEILAVARSRCRIQ
jgi:hypothetical protein